MRYVHGMEVLETVEEVVDPQHSALIVVDVQNDFCSPGGVSDRIGQDLSRMPAMIASLTNLLKEARRLGLFRVFIQNTVLPDGQSDSGAWMHRNLTKGMKRNPEEGNFCIEGTWGHAVVDELQPLPGELRVRKHRSSAFFQTNLDLILRNNGIKTCIVTGVVTEGCVDSTVRDALFHDYYAVVPRECVASPVRECHEASLLISKADIVQSADLMRLWSTATVPARGS